MAYWILKTEPTAYSYDRLARDGSAVWDGVSNPLALKHLRTMQPGDEALIYHTGGEKAVVGLARITSAAYEDPKAKDPRLVVVNLKAAGPLKQPVTLAAIKAEPAFRDLALVRMPRLSVVPATAAQWKKLLEMSGSR
jgi:predicted RNA-binding protein with PUA-like domain